MTSIADLRVVIPSHTSPAIRPMGAPRAGSIIPSPAWGLDDAPIYPVDQTPPPAYLSEEARAHDHILPRSIHRFDLTGNLGDAFLVERIERQRGDTTFLYDYIAILHPMGTWRTVAIYKKGAPSSFPFRHYHTLSA